MAQDNTGMVQRGLFLFALLSAIAVVTLFAVFYRPAPLTNEAPPAQFAWTLIPSPTVGFPASLNWAALTETGATLPSAPGWAIRYNAARSLAYRGSSRVPLDILAEMLDEDQQVRNNIKVKDGKTYVDMANAQMIVTSALKAVRVWHKNGEAVAAVGKSNPQLQKVQSAVERLCASRDRVIQSEAEQTRLALRTGS